MAVSVRVAWAYNSTSDGFNIRRKSQSDAVYPTTPMATVVAAAREYVDSTAPANNGLNYEVRAVSNGVESDPVAGLVITTPLKPATPTALTLTVIA